MKGIKYYVCGLCAAMLLSGCGMSNTAGGALIGTGAGAALGAGLGAMIGKGKGAAIGAAVGGAVGAGAGVLIGRKMDKAKAAAAEVQNAQVETVTDANGLQAVKVTFDGGILFGTGGSSLSSSAKTSLTNFANNVLKVYTDADVAIKGFTDNAGWKNSTAEQSQQKNYQLSQQRANAVSSFLTSLGVSAKQIKTCEGLGENSPVASNDTEAGRALNRRVEIYLYASEAMIQAANEGTLK